MTGLYVLIVKKYIQRKELALIFGEIIQKRVKNLNHMIVKTGTLGIKV